MFMSGVREGLQDGDAAMLKTGIDNSKGKAFTETISWIFWSKKNSYIYNSFDYKRSINWNMA